MGAAAMRQYLEDSPYCAEAAATAAATERELYSLLAAGGAPGHASRPAGSVLDIAVGQLNFFRGPSRERLEATVYATVKAHLEPVLGLI